MFWSGLLLFILRIYQLSYRKGFTMKLTMYVSQVGLLRSVSNKVQFTIMGKKKVQYICQDLSSGLRLWQSAQV